ncbi:MAG: FAD-dependent oxidoreductase, partial [Thermoplasmata archaeon]
MICCSIAYNLSEEFGEDVLPLGKDYLPSGISGISASILSPQPWDGTDTQLLKRSITQIEEMSKKGEELVLNQDGLLRLGCSEREIEPLKSAIQLQRYEGCDVRYLEPDEVSEIFARLQSMTRPEPFTVLRIPVDPCQPFPERVTSRSRPLAQGCALYVCGLVEDRSQIVRTYTDTIRGVKESTNRIDPFVPLVPPHSTLLLDPEYDVDHNCWTARENCIEIHIKQR